MACPPFYPWLTYSVTSIEFWHEKITFYFSVVNEGEQFQESLEKWFCLLQAWIQWLFQSNSWQHTHNDILDKESKCFF